MVSLFGGSKDPGNEDTHKIPVVDPHTAAHGSHKHAQRGQGTRGVQFEDGQADSGGRRSPKTQRRRHASGYSSRGVDPEALPEARCKDCDKLIYMDPKTRLPYDPQPPRRPEICGHCGREWPEDKPFSERILLAIEDRLAFFGYRDVKCKSCYEAQYIDRGTQVDERDVERGRKRALLIIVTYRDQKADELSERTKVNVEDMQKYLIENGYRNEDIEILMEQWDKYRHPTRDEIVRHMNKLVNGAKDGDYLFFHYSGRGNEDGIYPVDYKINPEGVLTNATMREKLVDIPEGVHLTAIFDSCHSSSILDLPYVLTDGEIKRAKGQKRRDQHSGSVVLWSGWKDTQTSAKPKIIGKDIGVMSEAFIKAHKELEKGALKQEGSLVATNYTYGELLDKIKSFLQKKSQIPQLSSTQHLDLKHEVYV